MTHSSSTITSLLVGLALVVSLLALGPSPAHAIPSAGEYEFTEGLSGTFISDGFQLTDWSISVPSIGQFTPPDFVLVNIPSVFDQILEFPTENKGLIIFWNPDDSIFSGDFIAYLQDPITLNVTREIIETFKFSAVPEPHSLVLLGAGLSLLVLVESARRRRRPTGLQVG